MKEEQPQSDAESQRLTYRRSADYPDHAAEQLNENYTAERRSRIRRRRSRRRRKKRRRKKSWGRKRRRSELRG